MRAPDPTHRFDTLKQGLEAAGFVILDAISAGKRTDIAVGSAGDAFWNAVSTAREKRMVADRFKASGVRGACCRNAARSVAISTQALHPFDS